VRAQKGKRELEQGDDVAPVPVQSQISRVCGRFDNCTTIFVWAHHPAEVNATMCTGSAIAIAIILTMPDAKVRGCRV
jgi:hypothetical protein